MQKPWLKKEKLNQYLLIVSIITISIIGIYYLLELTSSWVTNIISALSSVLIPFIIAFFLSFIVGPLATNLEKKLKINQNISIAIAIFIGILFMLLIVGLVIVFIFSQVSSVLSSLVTLIQSTNIESMINQVIDMINQYFQTNSFTEVLNEIASNGITVEKVMSLVGAVLLTMTGIASNIFKIIAIFVLTPVFMFYLMKEKEYIFSHLAKIFPKSIRHHVIELGKRSDEVIKNYFRGQGMMIGIISIYFSITLVILSFFVKELTIHYAIMFAILMGLMNIIPYIGAWIGLAVPIVFLLTLYLEQNQSPIFLYAMVAILIIHLIEQALEITMIQPLVLGKQVHIHPLLILSSLIFFGGIFGFAGVLLAVPLAGTLRAVAVYLDEINQQPKKKKQPKSEVKEIKEDLSEEIK